MTSEFVTDLRDAEIHFDILMGCVVQLCTVVAIFVRLNMKAITDARKRHIGQMLPEWVMEPTIWESKSGDRAQVRFSVYCTENPWDLFNSCELRNCKFQLEQKQRRTVALRKRANRDVWLETHIMPVDVHENVISNCI